jgi:pilus assembly protein CpaB
MNWKTWVPLVLAIVLGVVAAKVARDTIMKNKGSAVQAGKFTKIAILKGDVHPGKALAADDLALGQFEIDNVPTGSFKTTEEVVGRVSETLMIKGQPVVEAMLAPTGSGSGLQALVPPGQRAITIEVNEFSGVAGLLTPGCRVDILATLNDGSSGGTQLSRCIVQNVKVSAVGQKTMAANEPAPPPGSEMFKSVTMLVTLADAEAIELACATGRPRLVLRGGRDNEHVTTAGMTIGELKGTVVAASNTPAPTTAPSVAVATTMPTTQSTEVAVRQEPAHRVVKVIRGGVVTNVTIKVSPEAPDDSTGVTSLDPFEGN